MRRICRDSCPPRPDSSRFDLEGFLAKHGVRFRGAQSYQGGRKLILEECPWDPILDYMEYKRELIGDVYGRMFYARRGQTKLTRRG